MLTSSSPRTARRGLVGVRSLLDILHKLLRAERDQHADDDDADFAGELAPAMQWFRQSHLHQLGSHRLRERDRHAPGRNGRNVRSPSRSPLKPFSPLRRGWAQGMPTLRPVHDRFRLPARRRPRAEGPPDPPRRQGRASTPGSRRARPRTAPARGATVRRQEAPGAFALLPRGGEFEVVGAVKTAGELSPWCLAKLAESLPEGTYKLAEGDPGHAALGWLLGQHRFDAYRSKEMSRSAGRACCSPAKRRRSRPWCGSPRRPRWSATSSTRPPATSARPRSSRPCATRRPSSARRCGSRRARSSPTAIR